MSDVTNMVAMRRDTMATIFYGKRNPFNPTLYPDVMYTSFVPVCELPTDDLEVIFREMNVVDGMEIPIDLKVRSLSVGDLVVVDGKGYLCAGCGWEPAPETLVGGVLSDLRTEQERRGLKVPKFALRCH